MPQTSFQVDPNVAQSGQLADVHDHDSVTKVVGQATAIKPGLFVVRGTDVDKEAVVPSATTDITGGKALGFVRHKSVHIASSFAQSTDRASYAEDSEMPVVRRGRMYVRCENAFTAGTKVFVRFTANGAGKVPGNIRSDADTDKAVALPNARFENSGDAGELALIRFDVWPTGT